MTRNNEVRVAVALDDNIRDRDVPAEMLASAIEDALDEAGIDLSDNVVIGYVTGDEMGGDVVSVWLDRKMARSDVILGRQSFITPWSKYAYYCWEEWGRDEEPEDAEPVPFTRIPFDVQRFEDVEGWMPPAERTNDMVSWADYVVIPIDGQYTDTFRRVAEREGVECTTFLEINPKMPKNVGPYTPDSETPEQEPPTDEETVVGGQGFRTGSVPDLDEPGQTWVADDDESRLDRDDLDGADPGGRGVGSAPEFTSGQ